MTILPSGLSHEATHPPKLERPIRLWAAVTTHPYHYTHPFDSSNILLPLRVSCSQVLSIQHLHRNRGVGGTMRFDTLVRLAITLGISRHPSLTLEVLHPIMAGFLGDSR